MQLSPDGGATPAPRREGNREAQHAAYESGMVFRGKLDIPVIDWRHYLEAYLDMHNSHQSFAARQRLLNYDGDASNQLIWFTAVAAARPAGHAVRPDAAGAARARPVAEEHRRAPGAGCRRATSRPTRSTRASTRTARCSRAGRRRLGRHPRRRPEGGVRAGVPAVRDLADRRGRPDRGRHLQVQAADGPEGARTRPLRRRGSPSAAELARLNAIFPTGVCDYSKGDAGEAEGPALAVKAALGGRSRSGAAARISACEAEKCPGA